MADSPQIDPPESDLRYPVGRFQHTGGISQTQRELWTARLKSFPAELRSATTGLTNDQLETLYRPNGWTVRQVVHHLADSHMNSYVRFRLALTEDSPAVRSYQEAKWAELTDARSGPIEPSLQILDGVHARWAALLEELSEEKFSRTFHHSELHDVRLDWALGLYAWHSSHHLAHIQNLRERLHW